MLVVAVALFVAAPLGEGFMRRRRTGADELLRERLEHDRSLAVQGLRELEFDHEMGKLDPADYQALRTKLEARAMAAMSALGQGASAGGSGDSEPLPKHALPGVAAKSSGTADASAVSEIASRGTARRINFCPQCGARAAAGYKFCAGCGAAMPSADAAVATSE